MIRLTSSGAHTVPSEEQPVGRVDYPGRIAACIANCSDSSGTIRNRSPQSNAWEGTGSQQGRNLLSGPFPDHRLVRFRTLPNPLHRLKVLVTTTFSNFNRQGLNIRSTTIEHPTCSRSQTSPRHPSAARYRFLSVAVTTSVWSVLTRPFTSSSRA